MIYSVKEGEFLATCTDIKIETGESVITATCKGTSGTPTGRSRMDLTYCKVGNLVNNNKVLTCMNADGTHREGIKLSF